jgi:RimJ/RimL family protein N-acetyltransferase
MSAKLQPILTGARVTLRPLTRDDAPAMFASLADPELRRQTGTHTEHSLDAVRAHCARLETSADRWDYGIVVAERLIGEVVLNDYQAANRSVSLRIGIWEPAQRNQGYGFEATRLLVAFAFDVLDVNRLELEVFSFNPRARRVYEKAGFRVEGVRREALIWEGETVDSVLMAQLRSDRAAAAEARQD